MRNHVKVGNTYVNLSHQAKDSSPQVVLNGKDIREYHTDFLRGYLDGAKKTIEKTVANYKGDLSNVLSPALALCPEMVKDSWKIQAELRRRESIKAANEWTANFLGV